MVLDKYLRYVALAMSLVVLSYIGIAGLADSSQNPGHHISDIRGEIIPSDIDPQGSDSTLDADMVDGKDAGNSYGDIAVNNWMKNKYLNADLLDGKHAGHSDGNIPISDEDLNNNLNADMVDGKDAGDLGGTSISSNDCPSGEYAYGIRSDGTLKCKDIGASDCPSGEFAYGIRSDGTLKCKSAKTDEASTSASCADPGNFDGSCTGDVGGIVADGDGNECKAVAEEGSCTARGQQKYIGGGNYEDLSGACCVTSEGAPTKTVALCANNAPTQDCTDVCKGEVVSEAAGADCSISADVGSCDTESFNGNGEGHALCCECKLN